MIRHTRRRWLAPLLAPLALLTACQSASLPPMPTVAAVDLPRFMGSWYVIASIPSWLEKDAYNAVESYALAADGTIDTTFTFREGAFDGEPKRYTPRGFVQDTTTNALWGMRFVWPVKAEYRIIYLSDDYSLTVVGRSKRDYVWIMARTPSIPAAEYERLRAFIAAQGYDLKALREVPQQWPETTAAGVAP
jgi:apolipoprotein D and lipocalin family protein